MSTLKVNKTVTYRLTGDHTRSGLLCHPVGETRRTVTAIWKNGIELWLMAFENNDLVEVPKRDLQLIRREEAEQLSLFAYEVHIP